MEKLIVKLRADYPGLTFAPDTVAHWSPQANQISYTSDSDDESIWGTLHELGHALLSHQSYTTDVSLLEKEVSAWAKAETLARRYDITIDEAHIQNCLDTYRNWLHQRSSCPACRAQGAQSADKRYSCINCKTTWQVSTARFCRAYRRRVCI